MNLRRLDSFLFLTFFFLLLDQLAKELVLRSHFLAFRSTGFFKSFFDSSIFYGLALFLVLAIASYRVFRRRLQGLTLLSSAFLSAGALANAWDYFYRGQAVDFLNLHWFLPFWPLAWSSFFNLADVFIVLGLILLFF